MAEILWKKPNICEDCDVRGRCALSLLVGELEECLMFSSCSGKQTEEEEQVQDMQLEDGPEDVFRA